MIALLSYFVSSHLYSITFIQHTVFFPPKNMVLGSEVGGNIPTWEKVDYKLQIEEFFATIRKLNNSSLNPKT